MVTFCVSLSSANHIITLLLQGRTMVFLHGFLGTNEEWAPIMHAISGSARCVSVDLPGHGVTKMKNHDDDDNNNRAAQQPTLSIETVADLLFKFIEHITSGKVTLVGYSMGARIALYMALKFSEKVHLWDIACLRSKILYLHC